MIDPGIITIENSLFINNSGILGTCIYYSESRTSFIITIQRNVFQNNAAQSGAAAIYLMNNYQNIDVYKTNTMINNKAFYANDISTPPYKLKFITRLKYNSSKNNNTKFNLTMTPGVSNESLYFEVLDYYGQTIKSLNGSYSLLQMRNRKSFSNIIDSSLRIDGVTSATILNGSFR